MSAPPLREQWLEIDDFEHHQSWRIDAVARRWEVPSHSAQADTQRLGSLGGMHTLRTTRCILEPLVVAHAPEMFRVLSDPAIYEFENSPPQSEEWLEKRYAKLEGRRSSDGAERWLNWVVRLPSGQLAGYVQASVLASGWSYVAYELASRYWRQGIGSSAVSAMLDELRSTYGVHMFVAVLKATNFRSAALLCSLGFVPATDLEASEFEAEPDELVMVKTCTP